LKVTCLDPATGDALWEMPWENGGSWWGNSSPAVTGDTMVIQRHDGLECYILSEQGPREIWHIPHHEVASTPVLYQGHVYTLGGGDYGRRATVCCATLENGDVTWERDLDEAGCSTPIVADGKLFGYVDSGRKLAMWRTSPEDYAMLSLARVNADGYSSPAFSDGKLFVRLEDGVACYDLNRGANLPPTAVMEGERMPVGATTAPELLPQDQDVLSYGWSGGMQLFVRFDHVGQCVDFPVRVTHPGAYEISACMTRAADYGIVQFSVKGQALGAPFDGFSAHVTPTGPILLGTLNLPAGVTTLRLTIVGKNAASTGLLAGLDAMLFRR
jgi:outer membrane protein assembly factor BamB